MSNNIITAEIRYSIEEYTSIICRNVNCRFNRRFLGDLHCNFKHITMNERGECIHKEERIEHQPNK